jgi:hypothetical protein
MNKNTFLLALTNLTTVFMQQTPYDPSSDQWRSEDDYFDDITYRASILMSKICKRI